MVGSIVALATQCREGQVDAQALMSLCGRQVKRGTMVLVTCGNTGEATAMQPKEWSATLCLTIEAAAGRVPVIAGCGAPSTKVAMELATAAACHSIECLCGRALMAGFKDATADLTRLCALCGPDLVQLCGDDTTAAAHRASGGHGYLSIATSLVPTLCALLHRFWDHGDFTAFVRICDLLAPLAEALLIESNPILPTAALAMLDLAQGDVCLPRTEAGQTICDRLAFVLANLMAAEDAIAVRSHNALVS